jgi:hypothetical protein
LERERAAWNSKEGDGKRRSPTAEAAAEGGCSAGEKGAHFHRRTAVRAPAQDADPVDCVAVDFLRGGLAPELGGQDAGFMAGGGEFAGERSCGLAGATAERRVLVVDEEKTHAS